MKTFFFKLNIKELDSSRIKRYQPITESKSQYKFEIDKKGNLAIHFYDFKQRKIGFNLKKYFRYEITNIANFRYDDYNRSISYVYNIDTDFPVSVMVKFLRDEDYLSAIKLIRSYKITY